MEHCFVPSALLSSVPLPAQALRWKITFWGQTLIILLAPRAPSARLIILALWDENLELLFSGYQSRRLQALSVDKDPVSVYDREQRGSETNRQRVYVSQNIIAEVFTVGFLKSTVYLLEWVANDEPEGNCGCVSDDKTEHMGFLLCCYIHTMFSLRDSPFFTLRLLSDKSPYCERLFDDAPLRTLERAESPSLWLLMRDSFEELRCHVPVCAQVCFKERNADWCVCFLSVMRDPRREGWYLARVECESVWILWISCRCAPWLSEHPIILAARRSLPPLSLHHPSPLTSISSSPHPMGQHLSRPLSALPYYAAAPPPSASWASIRAVMNSLLDLFLICKCVCVRVTVTPRLLSCNISFKHVRSREEAWWILFYWSLTVLIFLCISSLLIFKQSVKWQWLEQEHVNRAFAYRKLLYYNAHSQKLSQHGGQNKVTSQQRDKAEK